MREPEVIAAYTASIAQRLSFDPTLSRRVRQEVEDHLWESLSASTAHGCQAAREVTARFGDPQVLAVEFAMTWLAEQIRRMTAAAILIVLTLLLVMKARLAWYGIAQWPLDDGLRALGSSVGLIDACAFWLAVILVVAAWAYLVVYRVAGSSAAQCRKFRHVVYLTSLCWLALVISVTCDVLLTAFRLVGREFSAHTLIPVSSVVGEIALVIFLVVRLTVLANRTMCTTALVQP